MQTGQKMYSLFIPGKEGGGGGGGQFVKNENARLTCETPSDDFNGKSTKGSAFQSSDVCDQIIFTAIMFVLKKTRDEFGNTASCVVLFFHGRRG